MARKMLVISDETPEQKLVIPGKGRGLQLPPRGARAYEGVADEFPDELLIPQSDWQGMIREQEERGTRIIDLADFHGVKRKNQEQTNYCWFNAPLGAMEEVRAIQNQEYVELSAASGAARIKNFRNEGGWGKEALQWLATEGAAPVSLWPANAINRKYDTAATREVAKKYAVGEWWELPPRSLKHLVSCILRGFPVAIGLNWWSHEVNANWLDWVDGQPAIGITNSWGLDWSDNGRGLLQGQRALPDDAVAPRTARAS